MQNKTKSKAILLTGATGALGSELVPRLLTKYPTMELITVVRANSQQEAETRLAQALDDPDLISSAGQRIRVLPGDVGKPLLGLDPDTAKQVAAATEKTFHLAANVRFSATLPESRAGNVETTRAIIDFSRQCKEANPERFELHYASTAYVVGDRQGPLREDELDCGQGFWNAYEQSKLEAEQLAVGARQEMPVSIYRPSQVICLSADGRVRKLFGFLEFMKLACSGRVLISVLPARPEVRSDMVPIDYVCDAMSYLSGEASSLNKTFHLVAGVERSLRLDEVIEIAYQIIRQRAPDLASIRRPQFLPPDIFEQQANKGHIHQALSGLLGIYQTYLTYDRDFEFETTSKLLAKGGIHLPPMSDVIERSVRYVVDQHFDAAAIQKIDSLAKNQGLPKANPEGLAEMTK